MHTDSVWLKCQAMEGMFPDEAAVVLDTVGGRVSFFAPKSIVRGKLGGNGGLTDATVMVYRLEKDADGSVVVLPQPPIAGSTIVKVKTSQIVDDE